MRNVRGAQHREIGLEQYYTDDVTAQKFVNDIDSIYGLSSYDMVLEPSAGAGHILEKLPKANRVGLDLDPKHDEVAKQDFFKYYPPDWGLMNRPKIITIGNPPFGRNSKMAVDFFNHAAEFSDTICFIIPVTWLKYTVHKKLDRGFGLFYSEVLDPHCFEVDGKKVEQEIRCVAQCWSKVNPGRPNLRIYQRPKIYHEDFSVMDGSDFDVWMACWGSGRKHFWMTPQEMDARIADGTYKNSGGFRKIKFHDSKAEDIMKSIDWIVETHHLNTGVWFLSKGTMIDTYEKYKTLNKT